MTRASRVSFFRGEGEPVNRISEQVIQDAEAGYFALKATDPAKALRLKQQLKYWRSGHASADHFERMEQKRPSDAEDVARQSSIEIAREGKTELEKQFPGWTPDDYGRLMRRIIDREEAEF